MPEMHQTGAAGERMDSLGELMGFPRPPAAMGGATFKEREGRGGAYFEWGRKEEKEGERGRKGRGREFPPKPR